MFEMKVFVKGNIKHEEMLTTRRINQIKTKLRNQIIHENGDGGMAG